MTTDDERLAAIKAAAVEDPGHLLPQDKWDEVQRQVAHLQETDPRYHPDPVQRAPFYPDPDQVQAPADTPEESVDG